MTQDYRKRAEEFLSWYSNQEVSFSEGVDLFEKELQSLAKEYRREENEACAKICEDSVKPELIAGSTVDICTMNPFELAKAIRNRMKIGPETMEEK